jgi:inosose dehydratase
VDFAGAPGNPAWPAVLDGIVRAGYAGTELGPLGYLPEDPGRLREELAARDLAVTGSFVFQPLHDPARLDDVLAIARRTCALIAGAGGRYLVIIDLVGPERAATAGRSGDAPRRPVADGVRAVAAVAREEHGLVPVVHPHAGSFLEFGDEIEALLDAVDVGLCLDTGHAAYAGVDPVALYRRYADRIPYLHLKDVDPAVRARAVEELDFWQAVSAGVFCPLGSGMVDFPALAAALREHGFDGWATVEQDRDPGGDPVSDLVTSRTFLERLGIADAPARR